MTTFTPRVRIECGDALELLRREPEGSVDCCVTSPPYFALRDYGHAGQIGLEATAGEYVSRLVEVFGALRRVLRRDGTLWLNLGDSFVAGACGSRDPQRWPKQSRNDHAPGRGKKGCGPKPKDLCGIPWRVAFALQADGWWLRTDIIWAKPNPMPESVGDRPTRSHEYLFLLAQAPRYWYDAAAISEPSTHAGETVRTNGAAGMDDLRGHHRTREGFRRGVTVRERRNARSVWTIATQPYAEAHFATFPEELARRCILAGCPRGGTVLDPFGGSGTVGAVAARHDRHAVLFDLNPDYCALARRRVYPEAQPRLALGRGT